MLVTTHLQKAIVLQNSNRIPRDSALEANAESYLISLHDCLDTTDSLVQSCFSSGCHRLAQRFLRAHSETLVKKNTYLSQRVIKNKTPDVFRNKKHR